MRCWPSWSKEVEPCEVTKINSIIQPSRRSAGPGFDQHIHQRVTPRYQARGVDVSTFLIIRAHGASPLARRKTQSVVKVKSATICATSHNIRVVHQVIIGLQALCREVFSLPKHVQMFVYLQVATFLSFACHFVADFVYLHYHLCNCSSLSPFHFCRTESYVGLTRY